MRREDKYPNTETFQYYNANPKNRITTDCVLRAVCTALQQDYITTLREMTEVQCKTGYSMDCNEGINKYLESKGWYKCSQPRKSDNTKYTGEEFCRALSQHRVLQECRADKHHIIANIGSHHIVAIINYKVHDIWNSTDGCIGNYWVKR